MSLILEALRKSEAERRRGESPGLRAELPPAPARPRRGMPAWSWAALAAVALALALVLLWPGNEASDGHDRATAAQRADDGNASTNGAPSVPASPPSAAIRDALPRVDRIEPRATEADGASSPEPAVAATTLPATDRVTATRMADKPDAMPEAPPVAAPSQTQGRPTRPGRSAAGNPDTPAVTAATATTPPIAASPASDLPRLSELPPAQRRRLPAMKLSMHMWNADPARRFAIIDGHRQVEGDRVGDATITAIDADGVLLELDGRPVRLPLR